MSPTESPTEHTIFLSWSGEVAKQIGLALYDFFETVLTDKLFFSEVDIPSGEFWNQHISSHLNVAAYGVIILTQANLYEPWLLFEAGAIKFNKGNARCCPLFFGDLQRNPPSPFETLQAVRTFEEQTFRRLTTEINEILKNVCPRDVLPRRFDPAWLILKDRVAKILQGAGVAEKPRIIHRDEVPQIPPTLEILRQHWSREYAARPHNHDDFKLFTFCGISDDKDAVLDHVEPTYDREGVFYLWADSQTGSTISAKIMRDGGEYRHRIDFDNKHPFHMGNVAIRPVGKSLLRSKPGTRFQNLEFQVRLPKPVGRKKPVPCQVGVRIIDALNTHWKYGRNLIYDYFLCNKVGAWEPISIDLTWRRPNCWQRFVDDGNYLYAGTDPDFSAILAVVIEVGKADGGEAPVRGAGAIEIANFKVS